MKILTIIGARPQFIKAAVVSRALRDAGLQEVLLHTGQHFDDNMSRVFFEQLGMSRPEYHFALGGGGHGEMTGEMMKAIEPVVLKENPDWVMVYGDTNSTLAGALVAAKLHVPVAHVEAGLRSFNRRMPEEINRICADHVSDLLFCSSESPARLLAGEGIVKGVHIVGDVMADSLAHALRYSRGHPERFSALLDGIPRPYSLLTLHRAENTDDPARLGSILDGVSALGPMLFPVHPRTDKQLARYHLHLPPNITRCPPLGYLEMAAALDGCARVLTDSGGLQKEAWWARKPCITLRDETEWVETVGIGWNLVVGADAGKIRASADWTPPPHPGVDPFGGEGAASRIAGIFQKLGDRASHDTARC